MLMGILLMAIWLIATGVLPFTKGRLPHSDTVMNVLAIVGGSPDPAGSLVGHGPRRGTRPRWLISKWPA